MTMSTGKGKTDVAATTVWFAPDTNFFIQCKAPAELDWSAVTDAPAIVLLVVRTVVKEIDGHKHGGNQRRADRARATASIFGTMLDGGPGFEHVYRESRPRVVMRFGPRLDPSRQKPDDFDADQADDRIVEQVLATGAKLGHPVSFLTHDNGPRHTAGEFGVLCMKIPDAWKRELEPDPDKKRLTELERRVEQLAARDPKVTVEIAQNGEKVKVIKGMVDAPAVLPDAFIEQMQRLVAERHPKKLRPDPAQGVTIFREGEWKEYLARYDAWLEALAPRMVVVAKFCNAKAAPVRFHLHLNNVGGATAEHPRVEVIAKGPIRLVSARAQKAFSIAPGRIFQDPPTPPAQFSELNRTLARLHDVQPDRVVQMPGMHFEMPDVAVLGKDFQWVYDEPAIASERVVGECMALRHGLDDETVELQLLPEFSHAGKALGSVSVRVSAPNLPKPFTAQFRVEIDREPHGVEAKIRATLTDEFGLRRQTLRDLGIS